MSDWQTPSPLNNPPPRPAATPPPAQPAAPAAAAGDEPGPEAAEQPPGLLAAMFATAQSRHTPTDQAPTDPAPAGQAPAADGPEAAEPAVPSPAVPAPQEAPASPAPAPHAPAAAPAAPVPPAAPAMPAVAEPQRRVYAHTQGARLTGSLLEAVRRISGRLTEDPVVAARLTTGEIRLTADRAAEQDAVALLRNVVLPQLPTLGLPSMSEEQFGEVLQRLYDEIVGLGPLGPLWRDKSVTEILVDGPDNVYVERDGALVDTDIQFVNVAEAQRVAKTLAASVAGRQLSPATPIVGGELPGARAQFVYAPVVKTGVGISIRKFTELLGAEKLLEFGALSPDMLAFLADCVAAKATILVSGGTGTGKTTVVNALSEYIPANERIVTIEDAFELSLSAHHVLPMQTKERASGDDEVSVDMAALMKSSLRMRPDRIIVGEVRDAAAANVLMTAANTGHDGTITTVHTSGVWDAVNTRLPDLMVEARGMPDRIARRTVASAIDLVVQVTRHHRKRFISAVGLIDPSLVTPEEIQPHILFHGELDLAAGTPVHRQAAPLPADSRLARRLEQAGIDPARWTASS